MSKPLREFVEFVRERKGGKLFYRVPAALAEAVCDFVDAGLKSRSNGGKAARGKSGRKAVLTGEAAERHRAANRRYYEKNRSAAE